MILLDTHALYWMTNDSKRLSKRAMAAIREARGEVVTGKGGVAVAAITLWEIAWLIHNHRIVVAGSLESFLQDIVARVIVRPITPEIAAAAVRLPPSFPRDPADRMIAATALVEGMAVVTADAALRSCEIVSTVW
ncbi:MAG TPA: type II toxin-antitoxin system VapC family toxin [Candidatus Binatia bacterium]|nr:type II toxin-antitoxin system VapC family toxin [Candidatus Binatia bacterium]